MMVPILAAQGFTLFMQRVVDGLENGLIYGALALAIVLIFRSTGDLNFAQGEMATFSAYIGWLFTSWGVPVILSIAAAMVFGFLLGAVIERLLIRPVSQPGNPLPVVIVTIGLFITLSALTSWIYSSDGRVFPTPFPDRVFDVGGVKITSQSIGILVVLTIVAGGLVLLFQRTKVGLAMRGVASNRESSRLVGIRVGNMLMLGWGLASALGALAACLIAPKLILSPAMMIGILIYAFAAATLGGFDSPVGAIVGGLILGVVESLAAGYIDLIGSDLKQMAAFIVILVVLLVRPQGLFGKAVVERV